MVNILVDVAYELDQKCIDSLLDVTACPENEVCTNPAVIEVSAQDRITAVNISLGFKPNVRFAENGVWLFDVAKYFNFLNMLR